MADAGSHRARSAPYERPRTELVGLFDRPPGTVVRSGLWSRSRLRPLINRLSRALWQFGDGIVLRPRGGQMGNRIVRAATGLYDAQAPPPHIQLEAQLAELGSGVRPGYTEPVRRAA